jgi:sec-independent protein translocase protein TatC
MAVKRPKQGARQQATVVDHIRELQKRLFVSVIALVLAGIAVYFIYEPILDLLRSPLNTPLYYTSPAGSFAFVMKICFMGALAVTIPLIIYNVVMFIRPAFKEKVPVRRVYSVAAFSGILAAAGSAFGFLVIIPGALKFFQGFQVDGLSALISADAYLGFVTNVIITFVIMFQIPLLIAFIDTITPLTPKKLLGAEKWVILGSLVVSFLVPFALDITTSLLIALPIVALYNIAIVIVVMQHAKARRRAVKYQRSLHNIALIPSSNLALSELSFESLVGSPQIVTAPAQEAMWQPARPTAKQQAGMDIRPLAIRPAPVKPAPWVHRVHDQIALDPRAPIISDIAPKRVTQN